MNSCLRNIFRVILVSVAFFNGSLGFSQCAGTGAEVTICNKETDPSLQNFNLFDVLVGETAGGTWTADSNFNSNALDKTTGEVNLWKINRFGAHAFTYRNLACDTSSATVIINLGGYPGESNQNPGTNNVCQILKDDDDDAINIIDLFIFIDTVNDLVGPDTGGVWTEDASNLALGVLNKEFFDFENVPIGTYTFTYTVPAVSNCPERTAIIDVEVRRSPNPGTPLNLNLCETDDMSGLTNLNLFTRLIDADTNGEWTDANAIPTGEITNGTDYEINVQNIYNNFGAGMYFFTYKVLPEHPICDERAATVVICIEKQLNLEATVTVDCNGIVVLNYNSTLLSNGVYNLSYTISGNSLGTQSNTITDLVFQNGMAGFSLFPDLQLADSEMLTIQIDDIVAAPTCGPTVLCTPIVSVPPEDFDMYIEPSITVASTTGCELDDVVITYTNATDAAFVPLNGDIPVTYAINGTNYTEDVSFVNGNATSTLSASRFMQDNNQLVFFETNNFIHCGDIHKTLQNLIPAPPNPVFSIVPDSRCDASNLQFGFDSPSGEFISYSTVTFDIYQFGSEPQQFAPRDASVSLTNNTQGDGIDINIVNSNDVSTLPNGDYVFVIRSVQNDAAACRGLSQLEIDNYTAQGMEVGLTKEGTNHIFDARLTFRIGDPEPVALVKNAFEVCLVNGAVTLSDLNISAGADVDITVTDLNGTPLPDTYEITQDEAFVAVLKSAITGCDIGTEPITVTVVSEASIPVLNTNVFCSASTYSVSDLDVSSQNIIWYDAETNGTAYSSTDAIDASKAYWAEITISGGCVSPNRTQANITFVDKAEKPTPIDNMFCTAANATISDLKVDSDASASLKWYTSETGPAYTSISLALDSANEYWVSQTIAQGCESDRVQVVYTITDVVANPEPLDNNFCTANGAVFTLADLAFNDATLSRQGVISYFSDQAGTLALASTDLLENTTSPVYVQQVIAGSCTSDLVEVAFKLEDIASKPVLQTAVFCLESHPTVQDLLDVLQSETSNEIKLYENQTTSTLLDANIELASWSGNIYASQTILAGCESIERTLVNFTLENPTITPNDFVTLHCGAGHPTLNEVYLGTENILWFDENNNPLSNSEILQNGLSYFAQLQVGSCLSAPLEVPITLVEVSDPIASSTTAEFCGINEKIIADILEDEDGNMRFDIPINHTLVWYDSDDMATRNLLDDSTVLEQGTYYAVYEVDTTVSGERIVCESSSLAISVDLTACSPNELVIPDGFSPNGDGVNETFELQNIQFVYPDYNIEIYNRYGRLVFKGNTAIGFWDGKSNQSGLFTNDVLPTGVYFYVIHFNRFDTKPYQGQVHLRR
ncbi:gliding motility-associated C-terminal domain-containing protein [Pseudotamlana agarivorans]|uniref:gliding motility-associated C-terminal domain-containing protein n=1 Tax=Pseudotamlana agarivorans TaxID=481183 RepID=UPI0008375B2F|nr:gliding motility-associated C-terminal domain-containing protein [Tamlana agarivorans]